MKYLIVLLLVGGLMISINSEELTKKEKEDQIVEMIKKYVEQKASSSEYIISCDKTEASKKLMAKLESPLTIDWNGATFNDVCDDLRTFMEINIVLHKEVSKDETVDLKLKDMKGLNAIKWILRLQNLRGSVIDGVLMITPPEKAPITNLIMITYDINDLTNTIKDFPASEIPGLNGIK